MGGENEVLLPHYAKYSTDNAVMFDFSAIINKPSQQYRHNTGGTQKLSVSQHNKHSPKKVEAPKGREKRCGGYRERLTVTHPQRRDNNIEQHTELKRVKIQQDIGDTHKARHSKCIYLTSI